MGAQNCVHLLRLLGRGSAASANRPNGLIGNDDFVDTAAEQANNGSKLALDDDLCHFGFALGECFAYANDGGNASHERTLCFDGHVGVVFSLMLAAFAVMGSCYVNKVEGRRSPSVALANNGAEESKGTPMHKEAHQLLKTTPGIRFVGNIEPRDVPGGEVDVVVCDGFTGNVILKLTEGVAKMLLGMLKQMFLANLGGKLAYLLLKGSVADLKHQMDSEEYGGAPFLGAKQPVIKAHGSSKAKGIKNAIRQAKICVENDLCGTMQSALDELAAAQKTEE